MEVVSCRPEAVARRSEVRTVARIAAATADGERLGSVLVALSGDRKNYRKG